MKKTTAHLIITIFLIVCVLSLSACNTGNGDGTADPSCTHSYRVTSRTATCTSGGYKTNTCSLCNHSYREYESALGHTTTSGTCTRCGENFQKETWKINFYVDEFKNPTDEAYICNTQYFIGTFSNSATTNSKLNARILIDADDICIKLWEYGSQEVNAYSTTYYDITVLDDAGNKHYLDGTMYKNGERIYLNDWTLVSLLQQNESLKIYIEEDSKYGYSSTYLFEIERGNFAEVYSQFCSSYMPQA